MEKLSLKKDILGLLVLAAIIGVLWYFVNELGLKDTLYSLSQGESPAFGISVPIFFIISYVALIVALVPSAPLNIIAGALFGPVIGTFYSWLAVLIGGSASFLLAKKFGESFVAKLIKEKSTVLDKYNDKLENDGYEIILLFRIIPFFPIAGFNYVFGLTKMKFRTYFVGSAIGTIPGIFILTYFGETLADFSWLKISVSIGLLLAMVLVSWMYKKKNKTT